jgi:hypothetical protein
MRARLVNMMTYGFAGGLVSTGAVVISAYITEQVLENSDLDNTNIEEGRWLGYTIIAFTAGFLVGAVVGSGPDQRPLLMVLFDRLYQPRNFALVDEEPLVAISEVVVQPSRTPIVRLNIHAAFADALRSAEPQQPLPDNALRPMNP